MTGPSVHGSSGVYIRCRGDIKGVVLGVGSFTVLSEGRRVVIKSQGQGQLTVQNDCFSRQRLAIAFEFWRFYCSLKRDMKSTSVTVEDVGYSSGD